MIGSGMNSLVLSLFPGIGLLDRAFEEQGFCVVRGPDVLWGGDIRRFHPPAGRFDGVIGGPPCQMFSSLANIVRAKGFRPRFGNLIPEFSRCVQEAAPRWFVMENVRGAPLPAVADYGIHAFLLNNRQLGEVQNRVRRWSFGWRGSRRVLGVETTALEPFEFERAALGGRAGVPVKIGENGQEKLSRRSKDLGRKGNCSKSASSFRRLCKLQGLGDDFDIPPFLVSAKCEAVGNGVPMAMGRAIAKAIERACSHDE